MSLWDEIAADSHGASDWKAGFLLRKLCAALAERDAKIAELETRIQTLQEQRGELHARANAMNACNLSQQDEIRRRIETLERTAADQLRPNRLNAHEERLSDAEERLDKLEAARVILGPGSGPVHVTGDVTIASSTPPLRWSSAPPTEPGWYWYRDTTFPTFRRKKPVPFWFVPGDRFAEDVEFAGPIAMPEEG